MATRCLVAEMELVAKGYSPQEARGAVRMCRKYALGVSDKVSPEIRDRVADELLQWRLQGVLRGRWVRGVHEFLGRAPVE
jgi:hypothetical protein